MFIWGSKKRKCNIPLKNYRKALRNRKCSNEIAESGIPEREGTAVKAEYFRKCDACLGNSEISTVAGASDVEKVVMR